MEAALRTILRDTLGEYVKGRSLEKTDLSTFPLVLRDLQLNEKKVQQEFDEQNESAIQLTSGKIGMVKVTPSWMGTVTINVSNLDLEFSFSPTQALKNQMKPAEPDEYYQAVPQGPPPNCPPRFCCAHDSSDKRVKGDPVSRDCKQCGITLQSSYKDFQLCPPCSEKSAKCMICGNHAPNASAVEPPKAPAPPMCPPRFCPAHDSSDKRVKGDPISRDCKNCGITLQSSYKDFQLCPPCSEKDHACMICGSHAPKPGDYTPGAAPGQAGQLGAHSPGAAPGQAGQNGQQSCDKYGRQLDLPPPPPQSQTGRSASRATTGVGAEAESMYMNNNTAANMVRPAAAGVDQESMYMSRPALPNHHYPAPQGSPRSNNQAHEQVFQTQLPPHMTNQRSSHSQPPRGAWDQRNPGNQQIKHRGDPHDDGFAGFIRFVASDIWKTCSNETSRRFESQDQMNRGHYHGGGQSQFQGATNPFQGGGGGQFQGMRRGGA